MSKVKYMDEKKVIKKGIDALMKELGPVEAIRFLNIPRMKRVESVKRHRQWQKSLKKDEFLNDVFENS
ncbi:MAG: hypothetical protein WCA08_09975 [Desulfoferrobacter sp.]